MQQLSIGFEGSSEGGITVEILYRPGYKRTNSGLFSFDNDNETIAVQLVENNATLDMRVDNNDRI